MSRVCRRDPRVQVTKFIPRHRFQCARMEQPERVRYVYDIKGTISLRMYDLLDVGTHPWKAIATRVGFAPEQIDLINQRALGRGESPSRAFMLKWSAQNPTMRQLFEVLNDCGEYRLMDLLRPIAPLNVVEMYYLPGVDSLLNGATAPPLTPVSPICNNGPVYPLAGAPERPLDAHYAAAQRPPGAHYAAPQRPPDAHYMRHAQQQHVNGTYGVPGVNVNGHYYAAEGHYGAPGPPHDMEYTAPRDPLAPELAYYRDQYPYAHRDNPVAEQRPTSSPGQKPAVSSPAQRPATLSHHGHELPGLPSTSSPSPRLPPASSPGDRRSSTPSPGVLSPSSGNSRSVNGYSTTEVSQMSDTGSEESGLQRYSYKEIVHGTGNWANQLGEGSFGKVYKVYLNGTNYAVKIFLEPRPGEDQDMRITKAHSNELKILSRIRHPNIIALYGYSVDEDVCLIYDFMSNGNLSQSLHRTIGVTGSGFEFELAWRLRLSILIDTACALQYLHTMNPPTVHCNVKSTNILLDCNYHAKLGDYCLAAVANNRRPSNSSNTQISRQTTFQALNLGYTAPEVNQTVSYGGKFEAWSDTFSFGVVILEVCTGLKPFDESREGDKQYLHRLVRAFHQSGFADQLIDKKRSDVPLELFRELIDLGLACVQGKKKRPGMVDVHSQLNLMKHTYGDQMRAIEMPVTPVPVVDPDGRVALGSHLSDPLSVSQTPVYQSHDLFGRSRSHDDAYSGQHEPGYSGQHEPGYSGQHDQFSGGGGAQNAGEYSGHHEGEYNGQHHDEQIHNGRYSHLHGVVQYMEHVIYGAEPSAAPPDNRQNELVLPLRSNVYGREFSNPGSPYAVTRVPKPEHYLRQPSNEYPSMSGVPFGSNYPSKSDNPYDPVLEPALASKFQSAIPSFRQSSFVHNARYDIPDAGSRNSPRESNARVELPENAPSKGRLVVELPNNGEPYLPETMNELSDSVSMTSLNPSRSLSCGHSAPNARSENDHYSTPAGAMAAISYGDRCSYGEQHNFPSVEGTRAANVRKAEVAISDSPTVSVRLSETSSTDDVGSTDDVSVTSLEMEASSLSKMTSGTSESRSESLGGTDTSDMATGSRRTSNTTDSSRTSDTTDASPTSDTTDASRTSDPTDASRTSDPTDASRTSDTTDASPTSDTTDTRRTSDPTDTRRTSDTTDTSRTSDTTDTSRTSDSSNRSSNNVDTSRAFDSSDTNLTSDTTDTDLTSDTTDTNLTSDIYVTAEPMVNGCGGEESTDENASSDTESVESELRGADGLQVSASGLDSLEPANIDEALDLNEKRAGELPQTIFALMN